MLCAFSHLTNHNKNTRLLWGSNSNTDVPCECLPLMVLENGIISLKPLGEIIKDHLLLSATEDVIYQQVPSAVLSVSQAQAKASCFLLARQIIVGLQVK